MVIHNAPFDLGFLDHEYQLAGYGKKWISSAFDVLDTLELARNRYPGKPNSLDALCRRYNADVSHRDKHGQC
ncbi:MAG: exonuclease domain-containing protein [Gammaproteobacteria bacterium]|nr:exonuclease domain-containing protein [Gammaproteobacteria bacterium]